MNIAVITPDRGDRPEFLACLRTMLENQILKPDHVELVNYPPKSTLPDITERYRIGYEKLSKMGFDVILFMENDDYYSPKYIQEMILEWQLAGFPDLFGTTFTTYYHIGLRKYFTFYHSERASMMNTLIRTNLKINWPADHEIFTDMFLWTRHDCLNGTKGLWTPPDNLSIGIKHGVGMCGGRQHSTGLHRYTIQGGLGNERSGGRDDVELKWLSERVKDSSIFEFYKSKYKP